MIPGLGESRPLAHPTPSRAALPGEKEGQPVEKLVRAEAGSQPGLIPAPGRPGRDPLLSPDAVARPPEAGKVRGMLPVETPAAEPDSWKKTWSPQVIYFPFTDRFNNADPTNDFRVDPSNPVGFHGGDLQGIVERLDYLQDMGVTTLWLSPLYDNVDFERIGNYEGTGYHGYWIRDHYQVEEHQGDLDLARKLVSEAHDRGMKVLLDVVLNHVAPGHPWVGDPSRKDWFHTHGGIRDWNDPYELEHGEIGGLPDLKQDNPEVYKYLLENTLWWIDKTGADGIRLDAVKHIGRDFWRRFCADIKANTDPDFLILGEVLHGDTRNVASYQRDGLDALFDMPLYFTIRDVFARDASARLLGDRLAEDRNYQDPDKLVTLLDNHDFPRFMHSAGPHRGEDKLKLAMAFLMSVRGIPSIYYGTEIGMQGDDDPDNRRMMEFGKNPELTSHFKRLGQIRGALPALQMGRQLEMWQDDQVYAFCRRLEGQEVVAVFNNSYQQQHRRIPLREQSPLKEGEILIDMLSNERFRVTDGALNLDMADKRARILVPERFASEVPD